MVEALPYRHDASNRLLPLRNAASPYLLLVVGKKKSHSSSVSCVSMREVFLIVRAGPYSLKGEDGLQKKMRINRWNTPKAMTRISSTGLQEDTIPSLVEISE